MDFANLGLNLGVVAGIIGITRVVTTFDKDSKLARWYPLIPAVLSIAAAAFLTSPWAWGEYGKNVIIYVGSATYLYKFGKTTVFDK
jgi:uncharacterized membrane protein HdeD (DUF308 family)